MKTKLFIIAIIYGFLSITEAFAQNGGAVGGSGSPASGTTPDGAVNNSRSLDPGLNQPHNSYLIQPNSGFSRSGVTNGTGWGSFTNGGREFTNGLGSGSMTNQMSNGGLNHNGNGNGFAGTGTNNGRRVNPNNPYANYTNPYATYINPNSTNVNPYATEPRRMERGGAITNN
jgi:hypothetical protein